MSSFSLLSSPIEFGVYECGSDCCGYSNLKECGIRRGDGTRLCPLCLEEGVESSLLDLA